MDIDIKRITLKRPASINLQLKKKKHGRLLCVAWKADKENTALESLLRSIDLSSRLMKNLCRDPRSWPSKYLQHTQHPYNTSDPRCSVRTAYAVNETVN